MKTLVRLLLVVGLVLVVWGHFAWNLSHSNTSNKVRFLQFPIIPGYAALLLGWTGWLAERVCASILGK